MAVDVQPNRPVEGGSGRRFAVGTNVVLAIVLIAAIAGVAQYIAHRWPYKVDMTSTGINSLAKGTSNLLSGLDTDVRLTSLYFKTDLEDEDQQRYRRTVDDLLGLYASTNRSKVSSEWINPLSDHEKMKKLLSRLREIPSFKGDLDAYKAGVERYQKELDDRMRLVVQKELELITSIGQVSDPNVQKAMAPVEELLNSWTKELAESRDQINALTTRDDPQYSAAILDLKTVYADFTKALNGVAAHGRAVTKQVQLPDAQANFLREAGTRYADMVTTLEQESAKLGELKPPKVDEVFRDLKQANANALVVETSNDAKVVDFSSVWPPLNPEAGMRNLTFKDRAFKGEEKLTSAILRATHKEQTAVVFVRFGGPPLFMGGFMPGQPQAPYAQMKSQIEDANFVVEEWDLKTQETLPEIDPKPTRTIYVVLKPTTPERNSMMGQQPQEPPISEAQKKAILGAIGENGRALFIGGWFPGPFPQAPMPATYEYNDYLKKTWGISIDMSALLMQAINVEPGKYAFNNQFPLMRTLDVGDHEIVKGAHARLLMLPWCAPLELSPTPPAGVDIRPIVIQRTDGVWGAKNPQAYIDLQNEQRFVTKQEGDLEGPFVLAAAATKGESKVVMVASRDFANDQVAFASGAAITSQGIVFRSLNPGNVTLLINSLHWLNDNVQFLDIGKPIDVQVLEIPESSTVSAVQILTIFVWPALAMICGGVAWWVRRR